MLCAGWSTGAVVTYLTRRVVKTACNSRYENQAFERHASLINKRYKSDKTILQKSVMGKGQSKENSDRMAGEDDEFFDRIVCQDQDIHEGQFKEVKLDPEGKVSSILIKQNGQLSALSNKCTHYGANLATGGSLGNGVIRCPWHGACFNVISGDIEVKSNYEVIHSLIYANWGLEISLVKK